MIALFLLQATLVSFSNGHVTRDEYSRITWNPSTGVSEFTSYGRVQLYEFVVEDGTLSALWEFEASASDESCPQRKVFIHLKYGSYPIVTPYNESFPDGFYISNSTLPKIEVMAGGAASQFVITSPMPGSWYAAAFLTKTEKHLHQKGLSSSSCYYKLGSMFMTRVRKNIATLSIDDTTNIVFDGFDRLKLFRFYVPDDVQAYDIYVDNFKIGETNDTDPLVIPLILRQSGLQLPSPDSTTVNCTGVMNCSLRVVSPYVRGWGYLDLLIQYNPNVSQTFRMSFDIKFHMHKCDAVYNDITPRTSKNSQKFVHTFEKPSAHSEVLDQQCFRLAGIGRLNIPRLTFTSMFVFPAPDHLPRMFHRIAVPDGAMVVLSFELLRETDTGGTLKLGLDVNLSKNIDQKAEVDLCLTHGYLPTQTSHLSSTCDNLVLHTDSAASATALRYIPYPQYGVWYLTLQSRCYRLENGTTTYEACNMTPFAVVGVSTSKCVDNSCGSHGTCQQYATGSHLYSACDCTSGWQGYACTDGTESTNELPSVLLLTLSNLFFIPAILLAVKRHFYTEALVYFYTMFFSAFYHACDQQPERSICIMKYDVLSFCDFFGSIMSFWVTLLAMSRIHERIRGFLHILGENEYLKIRDMILPGFCGSTLLFWVILLAMSRIHETIQVFLHILGSLCLALGVEYDRHGLWVFVSPSLAGFIIMATSWGVQCYRRRRLFPSWKRYVYYFLPGMVLVTSGLLIFARFETETNYLYTHSIWHTVVALSVIFFLPPKQKNAWTLVKFRDRDGSFSELEHINLDG